MPPDINTEGSTTFLFKKLLLFPKAIHYLNKKKGSFSKKTNCKKKVGETDKLGTKNSVVWKRGTFSFNILFKSQHSQIAKNYSII